MMARVEQNLEARRAGQDAEVRGVMARRRRLGKRRSECLTWSKLLPSDCSDCACGKTWFHTGSTVCGVGDTHHKICLSPPGRSRRGDDVEPQQLSGNLQPSLPLSELSSKTYLDHFATRVECAIMIMAKNDKVRKRKTNISILCRID